MSDLRKLARDEECQVRLPGICNFDRQTTVLAHIKRGWFGSVKPPDICGVWACSNCHDAIDRRRFRIEMTREELNTALLEALCRQLRIYAERGIVTW